MRRLLIVESPNKCKKIAEYLGPGWRVVASIGHIADLPRKQMGIAMPGHTPTYVLTERGRAVVAQLKATIKHADEVYIATDPDREGEAIAAHLAHFLELSEPKRVVFHEITKEALTKAIAHPRRLDRHLLDAQQGRRVTDRYVGYLVSPKLSDLAGQKLSAGRVQSIALKLLVERDRAIKNFKATGHFGARLDFLNPLAWHAIWDTRPFVTEDNPYVLSKAIAEVARNVKHLTVKNIIRKQYQQKAPPPFITTTLQKAGSLVLNLSASDSMQAAQTLFENGLISYHRTDNPNLSDDALTAIQVQLGEEHLSAHRVEKPNRYRSKAGSQEAHEAIRPTDFSKKIAATENATANQLYALIRLRAMASQMKPCITDGVTVTLDSGEQVDGKPLIFVAKSQKVRYLGWRILTQHDQSDENQEVIEKNVLPTLNEGDQCRPSQGDVLNLTTKPPAHFSEPSLISKLEQEGIGRPSTYAAILSHIQARGYVALKGKTFLINQAAEIITDALTGKFSFMAVEYTKNLENQLDDIASGKARYIDVVSQVEQELRKNIANMAVKGLGKLYPCPTCRAPLRRLQSKKKIWFWGCTRYQAGCKTTVPDLNGKLVMLVEGEAPQHPCPECGQPLNRIKGKNGFFWGCTGFKRGCRFMTDDNRGKPAKSYRCKKCNSRLRKIKTENAYFWGCTGFPNCTATYDPYKQPV